MNLKKQMSLVSFKQAFFPVKKWLLKKINNVRVFLFQRGASYIIQTFYHWNLLTKTPLCISSVIKNLGDLIQKTNIIKKYEWCVRKESFGNYRNIKVDMEAPFLHLKVGYGSKDTSQWKHTLQREGTSLSEKSTPFTKNHESPLCTHSWASN